MHGSLKDGVTAANGFRASGIHSGVRKAKKDLALVYSEIPANTAAVFTTNKVPAAPVIVDKIQLKESSMIQAIVVNSGIANACTGERGLNDAWKMVNTTAKFLGIAEHAVLVSSTGVIGQYLPIEKIEAGIADATAMLSIEGHRAAAEAIMTTDKVVKEYCLQIACGETTVTIGGMAKGSGMIAPNMATMLAFVTTDASISHELLQSSLRKAVDHSFNRISVDGDTSTNDMVIVLANGVAGNPEMRDETDPSYKAFYEGLEQVLVCLAKMIVLDGEGATKLIEIRVQGARTESVALQAAKSIANSNLVKTAIHGEDANWGRVFAALGYSKIHFNPAHVEMFIGEMSIVKQNFQISFSEDQAKRILSQKEITLTIDLHRGKSSATFWTCDLSSMYVAINANYRT